ncbi:MAG TPA: endonuclease/exonuclease/phosphatase family protein [Gemmataceae bacterium]|jgi:endonuclease/exonuclease/phosphatase family metal-dependent hydrolase
MLRPMFAVLLTSLTLAAVAAQPPADRGVQPKPHTRLKVMTFNLRLSAAKDGANGWEHRKDFALARIKKWNPDLLGVQEALPDQVDYLVTNLPGYKQIGVGREDGARKGEFSAIYLKADAFKIHDSGTFWLSETPDKAGSKSWDSALPRIVTWAKLTYNGKESFDFLYLNTHWDHRGQQARVESATLIRTWVRDHAAGLPVVMTGDLNSREESPQYKHLLGDGPDAWTDSYREVHPTREKEEATFHAFKGTRVGSRIDFILHSKQFRTIAAEIDRSERGGRYPSDHYPVWAELEYVGGK